MEKSIRRNLFLKPLATVYLLGFLQDLPEGNWLPVQLDFLQPCSSAVCQHEVGLGDTESLIILLRSQWCDSVNL